MMHECKNIPFVDPISTVKTMHSTTENFIGDEMFHSGGKNLWLKSVLLYYYNMITYMYAQSLRTSNEICHINPSLNFDWTLRSLSHFKVCTWNLIKCRLLYFYFILFVEWLYNYKYKTKLNIKFVVINRK